MYTVANITVYHIKKLENISASLFYGKHWQALKWVGEVNWSNICGTVFWWIRIMKYHAKWVVLFSLPFHKIHFDVIQEKLTFKIIPFLVLFFFLQPNKMNDCNCNLPLYFLDALPSFGMLFKRETNSMTKTDAANATFYTDGTCMFYIILV